LTTLMTLLGAGVIYLAVWMTR
jgi:hypothetical protein